MRHTSPFSSPPLPRTTLPSVFVMHLPRLPNVRQPALLNGRQSALRSIIANLTFISEQALAVHRPPRGCLQEGASKRKLLHSQRTCGHHVCGEVPMRMLSSRCFHRTDGRCRPPHSHDRHVAAAPPQAQDAADGRWANCTRLVFFVVFMLLLLMLVSGDLFQSSSNANSQTPRPSWNNDAYIL
jgi:hypothetical protein